MSHARKLVLLLALALACTGEADDDDTPPEPPALDLYIVPSSQIDPGVAQAGWPFKAASVTLSTSRVESALVDIPVGGRSQGRVIAVTVDSDGMEIEEEPIISRVVAWGEDGTPYVGTVEVDAFSHEFILRTPEGLYDIWVEPYDRSRIPTWLRGVSLPSASDLVVVIEAGIQVRGTLLEEGEGTPQPLSGVQVIPRNPDDHSRSGSVGTTSDTGTFAVRVPVGTHELWLKRDSAASDVAPLPAASAGEIEVGEGGISPLNLTLPTPETTTLVGEIKYIDRFVDGAVVTAERIPDGWPTGDLTVSSLSGTGTAPNPGAFALSLPEGSYTLTVEPQSSGTEPLAPQSWQGGGILTLPTSGDSLEIALDTYLVGLQGELLKADGALAARGTSLLFIPEEPLRPIISTMARGQLATFSVGFTPPGGSPIALGPGLNDVVMIPPVGAKTGRTFSSFNLTLGQTQLDLPTLPDSYSLYGALAGDDAASFENAVIKATLANDASYEIRWGPGPDPRDVVAEAIVGDDGTFTLRLASPGG